MSDAPDRGGIRQRRPGAQVVTLVRSDLVCQRPILQEQFAHAFDVAGVTRGRHIDERAPRLEVGHHVGGSHRPIAWHIPPAAVEVVAVGQVNRPGAVRLLGVDVRAAPQQLVDGFQLPGHRGPVDRLAGPTVSLADELRLGIEQLAHPLQVVIPQRQRDRFALRRGVEPRFERVRQQLLHLLVAAIACNLDRVVVHPEIDRIAIVLEQESHDIDAVLADGEVERLAIVVVRPRERWISCDERSYGFEIA